MEKVLILLFSLGLWGCNNAPLDSVGFLEWQKRQDQYHFLMHKFWLGISICYALSFFITEIRAFYKLIFKKKSLGWEETIHELGSWILGLSFCWLIFFWLFNKYAVFYIDMLVNWSDS